MRRGRCFALLIALCLVASGCQAVLPFFMSETLPAADDANTAFLRENGARDGVLTTASGLQYQVIDATDLGLPPTLNDYVTVQYVGRLLDGTVFDSTYERNEPARFSLDQVIAGWQEGLQLMPVGSTYRFWIPPELAYGAQGAGGVIPPNAVLVFDISLIGYLP